MNQPKDPPLSPDEQFEQIVARYIWLEEAFDVHTPQFNIKALCAQHNANMRALAIEIREADLPPSSKEVL